MGKEVLISRLLFLAPYMPIVLLNGSDNFDWVLHSIGLLSVQWFRVQEVAEARSQFLFPEH